MITTETVLDHNGSQVLLIRDFISAEQQNLLTEEVLNTCPEQKEVTVYNKKFKQPRLVKWFSDHKEYKYSYSYLTLLPHSMPKSVSDLAQQLSIQLHQDFPCCLANVYRSGDDHVSFHSDDEDELGEEPIIVSMSLGTTRKFALKNKLNKRTFDFPLCAGDLLIMSGRTQKDWFHSLKKEPKVVGQRICLTFRPYCETVFCVD